MANDSFNPLVEAYDTPHFRSAQSLTRNSSDAGGLTQQTFFIRAKQGHAMREPGMAKSWLFITRYCEFLRSRRRAGRIMAREDRC